MPGDYPPRAASTLPLADQAVAWLLLLRSGRATEADRAAFVAWLDADPRHDAAWQHLTIALGRTLGRIEDLTPHRPHRRKLETVATQPARRRFMARTVGLAACAGAGLLVTNVRYPLQNIWTDHASTTAERRHVTLADGSDVLLDARTRLNTDFSDSRRDVFLEAGAVSLRVASDPNRPLRIHTAQGIARAMGTRFMVRQEVGRTLVVVQEHDVEVTSTSGATLLLPQGAGVRFDERHIDVPRSDLMTEAAWQTGMIHVESRPLVQVVAALRPYYTGTLRISAAAGGLSVTGRYALDHVKGTLAALEQQLPIAVRYFTPWLAMIDMRADA